MINHSKDSRRVTWEGGHRGDLHYIVLYCLLHCCPKPKAIYKFNCSKYSPHVDFLFISAESYSAYVTPQIMSSLVGFDPRHHQPRMNGFTPFAGAQRPFVMDVCVIRPPLSSSSSRIAINFVAVTTHLCSSTKYVVCNTHDYLSSHWLCLFALIFPRIYFLTPLTSVSLCTV